jgi:hypothetical protein
MLKGLKILIIIWAAIGILIGLGMIFAPQQMGAMQGYATEGVPAYIPYLLASIGFMLVVSSSFIIAAMTRDLLKNILWVQFAIAGAFFSVVVAAYSMLMGFVTFQQVGVGMIIDGAFFVAFMALYPYRVVRSAARRRVRRSTRRRK